MLRAETLIEKLGEQYKPMIKQVKIADFTKCIAQISGLRLQDVSDDAIEDYLTKWATNKYHFFKMLGYKTRVDIPFEYIDECRDYASLMKELGQKYPAYYPWLEGFSCMKNNKIDTDKWRWKDEVLNYINAILTTSPSSINNMAVTSFFKRHLNASDELVTDIGRVYENTTVAATFTISIDPVDMMLASENPYGWTSCYRLEAKGFSDSHADGCLAAVIDHQSLITYAWNNSGKFTLYKQYEFKDIRYYRMRMWIAITPNLQNIHFNEIYPGKSNYSEAFRKQLREIVETYVTNYLKTENIWIKPENNWRNFEGRLIGYGYGEYDSNYIWSLKNGEIQTIQVYDEEVICPCGCGFNLPGTQSGECEGEELVYNGEGMICENFEEKHWCDYCDDYCEGGDCSECYYWRRENPVCELDNSEYCDNAWEAEEDGNFDPDYSRIVHCGNHCEGCPLYKLHHPDEDPEAADRAYDESRLQENE